MGDKRKLGEILQDQLGLEEGRIDDALHHQRERGGRLGEILESMKIATEIDVIHALAVQMGLPIIEEIDLSAAEVELLNLVPINFAKQHLLLPIKRTDDGVIVATADPLNTFALDDLRMILGQPVRPVLATSAVVLDGINRLYDRAVSGQAGDLVDDLEQTDLDTLAQELEEPTDLLDASDEAPIIRLVNSLLFQAVKERCSDVHIEPMEREIVVRFRRDGILYEILRPPKRFQSSIISRIKIMGGLNIAEKRLPQDGRIRIKIAGKDIDIRLSTVPTVHGERVVMRLLDKSAVLLDLNEIGFSEGNLRTMNQLIHKSHGILLVAGPTGSGKTTTLYAALTKINTPGINILTVEDPVEYQLAGVGQVHVNEKIDLSFANVLRSFLRQDPDVIMVGEMRDHQTVDTSLKAAETGHMVFSSIHTNDVASTITRLVSFFPTEEQPQVRVRLAENLKAVVSLRLLVNKKQNGRVPAVEVMRSTRMIQECIKDPTKTAQITEFIARGRPEGMQSFDQHLLDLLRANKISVETSLAAASNPTDFKTKLELEGAATPSDEEPGEKPLERYEIEADDRF